MIVEAGSCNFVLEDLVAMHGATLYPRVVIDRLIALLPTSSDQLFLLIKG